MEKPLRIQVSVKSGSEKAEARTLFAFARKARAVMGAKQD
jgi:hypothetical protein